jgi:hypothetical protein
MRSKSLLAVLATVLTVGLTATSAWAGKGGKGNGKGKSSEAMPDNISKQFQWEEKVVGPNDDKKIDHEKIARIQAQARKDEEAHKNEPTVKKTERAKGVAAPSTASLPTMDIEKPAAPAATAPRPAKAKPVAEARPRDSLDNLLDSEKDTGGSGSRSSKAKANPLDQLLAVDDKSSSSRGSSSSKAKTSKRSARRGRP